MATKLPQALGRDEKQGAQGPDEPGGQGHKGWRQGLRVGGGAGLVSPFSFSYCFLPTSVSTELWWNLTHSK